MVIIKQLVVTSCTLICIRKRSEFMVDCSIPKEYCSGSCSDCGYKQFCIVLNPEDGIEVEECELFHFDYAQNIGFVKG